MPACYHNPRAACIAERQCITRQRKRFGTGAAFEEIASSIYSILGDLADLADFFKEAKEEYKNDEFGDGYF
jgi:hypothetical protein